LTQNAAATTQNATEWRRWWRAGRAGGAAALPAGARLVGVVMLVPSPFADGDPLRWAPASRMRAGHLSCPTKRSDLSYELDE
jgi:hypothetical protein